MTTDQQIPESAAPQPASPKKQMPNIQSLSIQQDTQKRPLSFAELLKHNLPPQKEEPLVVQVPSPSNTTTVNPANQDKEKSRSKKKNKRKTPVSPRDKTVAKEKKEETAAVQEQEQEKPKQQKDQEEQLQQQDQEEQVNVWQQRMQQQKEDERNVLSPQSSPDGRGRNSPPVQQPGRAMSASGGYQQPQSYRNGGQRGGYSNRGGRGYYSQGYRSARQQQLPIQQQQQQAYRQYGNYQMAYSNRGVQNTSSQAYYAYVQNAMEIDAARMFVLRQIEYYFSVDNLVKDLWFRSQMDTEGYVSMNVIAAFNRIKSVTTNLPLIVDALRMSTELEVSDEGDKVRKKVDWHMFLPPSTVATSTQSEQT